MAAIRAGKHVVLNSDHVLRIEMSQEADIGGRIREDAAGNRTWQVTAHVPDARATAGERVYILGRGMAESGAHILLADMQKLLD
jgi:hypothetical protein